MKYTNLLKKLNEETDPKERMNARIRKRRQRSREQTVRQTDPFQMILVVKNKMNGEILIIDKESYTPKYHEIIVPAEKINQAIINDITGDPNFVQTETSKRLIGDVKIAGNGAEQEQQPEEGGAGGAVAQQMQAPVPMPKQEAPFTPANTVSGPMIAIGMMGGLTSKDLLKMGITEEELNDFNSSQEIQQMSLKIAKEMSFFFEKLVGRNIQEYTQFITKNQMFETSELWKNVGGFGYTPKSEITFRHKCIDESIKNKNKKCAETMCGCSDAGITPSEYNASFTVKYGTSAITSGKMNTDTKAVMYSSIVLIDLMLNNMHSQDLLPQFKEKEKDALKKLKDDVDFIKKISIDYINEKLFSTMNSDSVQNRLELIDKLADNIHRKIERILNSNILYQELFIHEALTGYIKFGPESPAFAKSIIALRNEDYSVSMDNIDLNYVRKIISKEPKFVVTVKSRIDPDINEKNQMEACKIRNNGKCPLLITPDKFLIRNYILSHLMENRYFKHSKLSYLFEQVSMEDAQAEFISAIQNANGLLDLMNVFAVEPDELTIGQVDLYDVTSTTYSAERNMIMINGKIFKIPVEIDPIPVSDQEEITEGTDASLSDPSGKKSSSVLKKKKLIKKPRDYKKETKYESTPEQKSRRAARGRARYKLAKLKLVRKGDKRDVDHRNNNTDDDTVGNLQIMSASKNRAKH